MTETESRCGQIAIVGAPNAGKSTLVNALVGQKVAITSAKVQTTRQRLIGIATEGASQLLLVDTPGIFAPRRRLDRAMVKAAWDGTDGADVIALVVDARAGLRDDVRALLATLADRPEPKFLVLNKVDISDKGKLLMLATAANNDVAFAETFFVSASTGDGVAGLKAALAANVPAGPWHFPEDQLTDASTRLMAAEITREQLYHQLGAELPYASTVETEKWEERRDGSTMIHQQILVERDSQKAIVLGKGGAKIRSIGSAARAGIGELLGRPVHLILHVKVKPDWADDQDIFDAVGLDWRA
jgi:GTP-binding protein Era